MNEDYDCYYCVHFINDFYADDNEKKAPSCRWLLCIHGRHEDERMPLTCYLLEIGCCKFGDKSTDGSENIFHYYHQNCYVIISVGWLVRLLGPFPFFVVSKISS